MSPRYPIHSVPTALRRVEVSEFEAVTKHPDFIRLGEKTQLSFVEKIYLGGRNSRLEHAYFIYHITEELCNNLVRHGFLFKEEARKVRGASLLHDIGHPPFSHAIENVLGHLHDSQKPRTHNDRTGEIILNSLSEALKLCALDPEEIAKIATKKSEKSKIISHNTLGTDKIGYVLLDAHHTGYILHPPYMLDLFPDYYYSADSLGVQESRRPEIEAIQGIIQDMYMHVYLNQDVLQYSRFVQRAIEEAVQSREMETEEIWDMPEGALIYRLSQSRNPTVKKQMDRYNSNTTLSPQTTLKIREDERYELVPRSVMELASTKLRSPLNITKLENEFAKEFGLQEDSVYITVSPNTHRVVPEDLDLYEADVKRGTLFERYPQHFNSLLERAEDFFAIRIYYTNDKKFPRADHARDFVVQYLRILE